MTCADAAGQAGVFSRRCSSPRRPGIPRRRTLRTGGWWRATTPGSRSRRGRRSPVGSGARAPAGSGSPRSPVPRR
ncbi:hypothetical protein XI38_11715 [Microbacterium aurantiacum]|uniref:Uncharacterized protein n=1 Tax=Microbacterium aurantiacum TaxID=162393 RepID=A0A0M9VKK0_9MICO|nr:hypothetical protein XI38_11715 [Microbacterium chocolatum]